MRGKVGIRIQPWAIDALENILPVGWGCRPIHQLMWEIGTLIKLIDSPFVCEVPRYSGIFVMCDVTGRGKNDANPRRFRRVPVCRVQAGSILTAGSEPGDEVGFGMIAVQCQK